MFALRTHAFASRASIFPSRFLCRAVQDGPTLSVLKVTRRFKSYGERHGLTKGSAPRNEKIPFTHVHVAAKGSPGLGPAVNLKDFLATLDLKQNRVELVSPSPPIVKVVSLSEVQAARKAARAARAAGRVTQKEVQMTWGVEVADFDHKLEKVRDELKRGHRVDVVFAPKSRHRMPPKEEVEETLAEVAARMEDIAIETRKRTIEGGIAIIHLEPDKAKLNKAANDE